MTPFQDILDPVQVSNISCTELNTYISVEPNDTSLMVDSDAKLT